MVIGNRFGRLRLASGRNLFSGRVTQTRNIYKQGANLFLEVFRIPLDIDMAALTDGQ